MVELPSIPNVVPQVQAPHVQVNVAQPYLELANALDKKGEALQTVGKDLMEDVAKPAAEKAGLQAVTRDDQGNVQVEKAPIFGEAATSFKRAVKVASLADAEGTARRDDLALREQFRDDPQGYLKAADEYRQHKIKQYSDIAGPEVGVSLGRAIDAQTTQTYHGLLNEHERLTLQRSEASINSGIQSARDDAVALARGGADLNSPAMQQALGKIEALTNEKVNNPRLAYPKEQAEYDLQHLQGDLAANRFLGSVDQTYKQQGAEAALKSAEQLLTDPKIKLSEAERYGYFHKATAEIHANEALRRQDLGEARKAATDAMFAAGKGVVIEPELQSAIMDRLKQSGGHADAARFAASMTRSTQLDSFNKLPLGAQNDQIRVFQTAASAKSAYQFFIERGYSAPAAAGIVGNLIQESGLNPNTVHDGGTGLGIAGHRLERLDALRKFAADRGKPANDFRTQLEFIDQELRTTEGATGAALKAAATPEAAARAFISYERPQGWTSDNPEAGHGFANRVANARQIFANASGAPIDQRATFGAGVDLRLAAGMQKGVDKKAGELWSKIAKDMDGGQTPNADDLSRVIDAFRLAGDQDMLETVAARVDRFEAARKAGTGPLPQQQALIAEFERRAAQGQLSAGDDAWRKDLIARNRAITKGLDDNPITTTLQNFPEKFKTPAPLDFSNDQALAAGLAMRGKMAQFAAENWQRAPVSALDQADVAQVQAVLQASDPAGQAKIFAAITTLPEGVRNATLAKIGSEPGLMTSAAASTLMREAPDVAQSILRGQQALKADPRYSPEKEGKTDFAEELDKRMPAAAFSLAGRTDPLGPFATARNMVMARYADLSAQTGDSSGKLNNDRLQKAVDDVTGGVLDHNGGRLIAPRRGMPQKQFDGVLWGLKDTDMAGVTTLSGQAVSADYIRSSAQLESIGGGRYHVRLGSDPLKPVYAYSNANTEAPTKFVMDLRGRQSVPAPSPRVGDIGQAP